MRISAILVEEKIKDKILDKHNVKAEEIEQVIFSKPLVLKSGKERYMAVGQYQRYLTIIFEMRKDVAFIITAYPSSESQRRLYQKKR